MVHNIGERNGINQILFFCHLHTQLCKLAKNGVLIGPYNVSVIEERDWGSVYMQIEYYESNFRGTN